MQGLSYKGVIDEMQTQLAERRATKPLRAAYLALARAIVDPEPRELPIEFGRELTAGAA